MLFNGKFVFFQLPMLFNGNLSLETLRGGAYIRTDGWMSGNSPLCPTGHRPFGAAAQKGKPRRIASEMEMREE